MSADFITSYPSWFILFCLLAGAGYATVLYFRNRIVDTEPGQQWLIYILSVFRFLAVSLIAFLLLEPLLRYTRQAYDKPVLAIAIDNSESIGRWKDSAQLKSKLLPQIEKLGEDLKDKFEVITYTFGSRNQTGNTPQFNEKETDIASQLSEIKTAWDGKKIAAVVLATDGIYNKGSNPYYTALDLKAPVFAIGLGDTTIKSDFFIPIVRTNAIAYLGNSFPVVVDVTARKCPKAPYSVQIIHKGKVVAEQSGQINTNPYTASFSFMLQAAEKGTQAYTVRITNLKGEITWVNNQKEFYIDIIDGRQKIMLLASAPHPDIAAFRKALEGNQNYELTVKTGEIPSAESLKGYDLVMMHNWLSTQAQKSFSDMLKAKKIPAFYVIGRQTNLGWFASLSGSSAVRNYNGSFNQSTATFNTEFSLFELNAENKAVIEQFPPLACPFGKYEIALPDKSLFNQRIGMINSKEALWNFNDEDNYRTGFIAGEGFWHWWLNNYERKQNHDACKELITKSVQWLSLKSDKRKFRVNPLQNAFNENEPVVFQAEVYNDNYEPLNKDDVSLVFKNSEGKSFNFTFSKTGSAYKLDAGAMPPGKYIYTAKTLVSGKPQTLNGEIMVKSLQLERTESVANHNLLLQMSEQTGGRLISADSIATLKALINTASNAKPVLYTERTFTDLINEKWLFFAIMLLLGIEWGIRKWLGAY